ncbi:multiple epidermal growth factor-like domains 10 [Elysia marginata]|uniref:Multiple epidermal growth factor-like domains 10 n=1 Tax=Elysia marginata TaxID=1093978 RepID=A0AAV4ERC7_9GAST|nr:multiple epidermal growth factor-like domains 10 [Elysia marginata]
MIKTRTLPLVDKIPLPACATGSYGEGCTKNCSKHCGGLDNTCNHVNGTCDHGCDPGYHGELCSQVCVSGSYGEGCTKNCSKHCGGLDNTCNNVNGTCDYGCNPGYHGQLCSQACATGSYGEGCTKNCSKHCGGLDNTCNHVNGTCDHGCDPGYHGQLCSQECNAGFYGDGCMQTCSEHCAGADNSCYHVNGTCNQGCDLGYHGFLCTHPDSKHELLDVGKTKESSHDSREFNGGIMTAVICSASAITVVAVGVFVWRGITPSKINKQIAETYGEDAMSISQVYQWCTWFGESLTSLDDEPKCGRPKTSTNEKNTIRVDELIKFQGVRFVK